MRSRPQLDVRFQGLAAVGAALVLLFAIALISLRFFTDGDDVGPEETPTALAFLTPLASTVATDATPPGDEITPPAASPTATVDTSRDKWGSVIESISEDPDTQMFRSNQARTGFVDDQSINDEPSVAWTAALGDQNFSVPVVGGNKIIVGGRDGVLTCFDSETGDLIWEFEARDAISSSPAIGHNRVFFGSFDGNFYAVDLDDGRRKWRFETAAEIHSSPAVDGSIVYFGGFDRVVYALSVTDGTLVWSSPTGAEIESSPALSASHVFIGSNDGFVYALDRLTGKRQWRVDTGGPVKSTPAVLGEFVYVASESGKVMEISIADGEVEWEYDAASAISYSSPAIENNTVVFGTEAGQVIGIRADNGRERWVFETESEVRASATIVDRVVYIGSYDENLYALALNTGELLWSSNRGGVAGSPVFADGTLYLSISAGELQALRPE